MHELSIVMSIVDLAETALKDSEASQVEQIDLEIGMLSGVEWDALDFAWPVGVKGTALEKAQKIVHRIRPKLQCRHCQHEFLAEEVYALCPSCQNYGNIVLAGKELRIKSMIVN